VFIPHQIESQVKSQGNFMLIVKTASVFSLRVSVIMEKYLKKEENL
jgi:hypothetical protein